MCFSVGRPLPQGQSSVQDSFCPHWIMNSHPRVDFLCLCFERAVTNQFENCTEQQRERHGGELLTCTAERLGYWWVKTVCRHICHRHRQEAGKEIAETSMSYLRVVGGEGGGGQAAQPGKCCVHLIGLGSLWCTVPVGDLVSDSGVAEDPVQPPLENPGPVCIECW